MSRKTNNEQNSRDYALILRTMMILLHLLCSIFYLVYIALLIRRSDGGGVGLEIC